MSEERRPAEVFPVGVHLQEELAARGWTAADLVRRMPGNPEINELAVDLALYLEDPDVLLGETIARQLAAALGTSPEYWLNLDQSWRDHVRRSEPRP